MMLSLFERFYLFMYLFWREWARTYTIEGRSRGRESRRRGKNPKQTLCRVWEPNMGLRTMTPRSWPDSELESVAQPAELPRCPRALTFWLWISKTRFWTDHELLQPGDIYVVLWLAKFVSYCLIVYYYVALSDLCDELNLYCSFRGYAQHFR